MIKLGYCRITELRTKFFYQEGKKELEFYIDRDPETSIATLWIRPGYTAGEDIFIAAIKQAFQTARYASRRKSARQTVNNSI